MNDLEKVAEKSTRGSFHLFIGNFLSEIFNAVGIIIVARLLGPTEMGIYGLSFVIPGVFTILTGLGLGQAMIRSLAIYQSQDRWGDVKKATIRGFLFQGGLACILAVVMFLASDVLASVVLRRPEMVGLVRVTSVLVISQSIYTMSVSVFYGLERMDLMATTMVLQSLVKGVAAPLLVIRGFGVDGAIYGHLLAVSAVSIISVILIWNYLRGKGDAEGPTSVEPLNDMLKMGFPLFLTTFVMNLNVGYQGILLAWFTDNIAIGNWDVAKKFLSLVTLFTVPITSVLYPAFSKFTFLEQPDEIKALFHSSVRYATIIVIPATTIMILLSVQGIGFLFGTKYAMAPQFLSLALLQFLTVGLGSLSVFGLLNSQGDTATTFRLNAVTAALNIVFCTLLTWRWGVPGLLVGLFLAAMAGSTLNLYAVKTKYGIGFDLTHAIRVAVFSLLAAIVTGQVLRFFTGSSVLVQMAVGGLTFLGACLLLAPLTKSIVEGDVATLRRVLQRERLIYPLVAPFLALEERIIKLLP